MASYRESLGRATQLTFYGSGLTQLVGEPFTILVTPGTHTRYDALTTSARTRRRVGRHVGVLRFDCCQAGDIMYVETAGCHGSGLRCSPPPYRCPVVDYCDVDCGRGGAARGSCAAACLLCESTGACALGVSAVSAVTGGGRRSPVLGCRPADGNGSAGVTAGGAEHGQVSDGCPADAVAVCPCRRQYSGYRRREGRKF